MKSVIALALFWAGPAPATKNAHLSLSADESVGDVDIETAAMALEAEADAAAASRSDRFIITGTAEDRGYLVRYYVDTLGMRTTPEGYRRGWTSVIKEVGANAAPDSLQTVKSLDEVDCLGDRFRSLHTVFYHRNGHSVTHDRPRPWQHLVPDTQMWAMAKVICGRSGGLVRIGNAEEDANRFFRAYRTTRPKK